MVSTVANVLQASSQRKNIASRRIAAREVSGLLQKILSHFLSHASRTCRMENCRLMGATVLSLAAILENYIGASSRPDIGVALEMTSKRIRIRIHIHTLIHTLTLTHIRIHIQILTLTLTLTLVFFFVFDLIRIRISQMNSSYSQTPNRAKKILLFAPIRTDSKVLDHQLLMLLSSHSFVLERWNEVRMMRPYFDANDMDQRVFLLGDDLLFRFSRIMGEKVKRK